MKRSFTGPLSGLKVVEIGAMGPGPFCAMLLADLGADVIRVDRSHGASLPGPNMDFRYEIMNRGRRSIAVDLKKPAGAQVVLDLVEHADILIEGFRPGVTERLGIGPEQCLDRNPKLIYGRMTGFGQEGPRAQQAGHDINYIATSGVLSLIGRRDQPPTPPLSLLGDFGGGGMMLAMGLLAALWEAQASGRGQIVDAAMVDGSALLATAFYGFSQTGHWSNQRGTNLVDSGAPFYDAYQCADGLWIAVGAMETHFYQDLLTVLGLESAHLPGQHQKDRWPELKSILARQFATQPRHIWLERATGLCPCLSEVLSLTEAMDDEHAIARQAFVERDGIRQPAPAPRFSRTPATVDLPPPIPGEQTCSALADWGIEQAQIERWLSDQTIRQDNTQPMATH